MLNDELQKVIDSIINREKRYHKDAYKFVNAAVQYTVGKSESGGHVGAGELLAGISEFAMLEYSIFYENIFKSWGISNASDIGNIVFALIEKKVLGASPKDSIEDFNTDFDLFKPAHSAPAVPDRHKIKVPKID
ncbi:MAG: Minf_1886 family protein [Victivallales bacterium]|jgi:uncharacterized repeat protein (TIGR04138 family)